MRRLALLAHRWLGIALTAYLVMICLTGGIIVYRNELNRYFQPRPRLVAAEGRALLSDAALTAAADRAHPGFKAVDIDRFDAPNRAVHVFLMRDDDVRMRLFDPYSGEDLGHVMPFGYRATRFMIDLHADLLMGDRGRSITGALALALTAIAITGWIVWALFPVGRRRKARRDAAPSHTLRTIHRLVGLWLGVFALMWGVTGAHLSFPSVTEAIIERIEPLDYDNPVERVGDKVSYWLTYAHFGRFGGRLPGCARRGPCDQGLKAVWAGLAITPALLAMTGLAAWALRTFRRRRRP